MARRSIKSKAKSKVQSELRKQFKGSLTPNQKEFLKQTRRLEREIKSVARRIEHPLTEDDILSLLPANPKVITKKYLKKLAKQTAKELLASVLGENPIAREVAEKVVDVVAENVTPADDENVSRETQEDIPQIGILERVADHILALPDDIQFRSSKYKGWMHYDLSEAKAIMLDAIQYRDWKYGALDTDELRAIVERLQLHEGELITAIDHIPRASTEDDYNITYNRILAYLSGDMITLPTASTVSDLTEKLGE